MRAFTSFAQTTGQARVPIRQTLFHLFKLDKKIVIFALFDISLNPSPMHGKTQDKTTIPYLTNGVAPLLEINKNK